MPTKPSASPRCDQRPAPNAQRLAKASDADGPSPAGPPRATSRRSRSPAPYQATRRRSAAQAPAALSRTPWTPGRPPRPSPARSAKASSGRRRSSMLWNQTNARRSARTPAATDRERASGERVRNLRRRGGGLLLLLPLAAGAGLAPRRLLLLLRLLLFVLRRLGAVHELQEDQRRVVARAVPRLDDPRVAAVPVAEARRDGAEELAHDAGVGDHREDLAPRVEGVALGERDHVLGEPADGLGLRLGRLDPLVTEQRHEEVAEERPAVRGDAAELEPGDPVPHRATPVPRPSAPRTFGSIRMPSESPRAASAVLISSMDFSPRFFTCSRSPSAFWTRSTTRLMSAFLSALIARAGSASSSSVLASASRRKASPPAPSVSTASSGAPAASVVKCPFRYVAARASASSGLTPPFVHTSSRSFS